MRSHRPLIVVLLAGVILAGCAKPGTEPPDNPTAPQANSAFCKQVAAFRSLTDSLSGQGLVANREGVRTQVLAAQASLVKLADVAPAQVKDDVSTVAAAFARLAQSLANLKTNDSLLLIQAVNQAAGDKVTRAAVSRIDTYVLSQCGLNTFGGSTTVPTTQIGPVAPTTTGGPAGPTTTAAPPSPTTTT